jgi:zinc transporter
LKDDNSQSISWRDIKNWNSSQGILWLHLDYSDENVKQWLFEESGIDPVLCEALLAEETRPRIISSQNSLLLILRGVNCNPGSDPEDMVSIRMWFDQHRIITMRHRWVAAIDDINKSIQIGEGPTSVNDFLVNVAGRLADRMGDIISEIDDSVDELEDLVLTEHSYELRPKIANLRRQTISLRRYIAPQRDVLSRLQNERLSWLSDIDRLHIREIAERTARFVDDLDASRDRASITHEELNSRVSEQMNKTMYLLSIVAAIFLPLGLITGLLGINVGGIPGSDNRLAFTFVSIFLVVFAFSLLLVFKRKRWL